MTFTYPVKMGDAHIMKFLKMFKEISYFLQVNQILPSKYLRYLHSGDWKLKLNQ